MATAIFKGTSCRLINSKGGKTLLKGSCVLNFFDDSEINELVKLNPAMRLWLDTGDLIINSMAEDNAKADYLHTEQKAEKERNEDAKRTAKKNRQKSIKETRLIKNGR